MSNKKFHITLAGARTLRDELQFLMRTERPKVTEVVANAAALGDRSENADYIYGKRRLRAIDRRIRFLTKRIDSLEVVDRKPSDQSRIYFGAWVKIEKENGKCNVLRIVGEDELDLSKGWISLESPMAKSLMGKQKGDYSLVQRPEESVEIHILDVSYEPYEDST